MPDENFLKYVRRLPSVRRLFDGEILMPQMGMYHVLSLPMQSDAHHLPSPVGDRRRTCDWFTAPLSRQDHDWIHTAEGMRWERDNLERLYAFCLRMLYSVDRIPFELYAPEGDALVLTQVKRASALYYLEF